MKRIILFFFPLLCFSQDYFELCLKEPRVVMGAENFIQDFLLPGEKVFKSQSEGCLAFLARGQRREILTKLMKGQYLLADSMSASTDRGLSDCRLKVMRIGQVQSEKRDIILQKRTKLDERQQNSHKREQMGLVLSSGKAGRIQSKGKAFSVVCQKKASGEYHLLIQVEGSVGVETELILRPGQRVEIGSLGQNQNKRAHEYDINRGVGWQTERASSEEKIFLEIQ